MCVGDTSVDGRYAPLPGTVACDAVTDAYELGVLGETIAELGVGEHVVEVSASVGTAEIRCAYAGTGFAEVIRFRSNIGFFMLIR